LTRVDLYVQNTMWTVGEDDFLHSFFSTIAYQVEKEGWGSRFPALVGELYRGRMPAERVPEARRELETIRRELSELPPEARVYDYDEPNRETPWPVPPGAGSLADCFLTATGKNMLDVLARALDVGEETGAPVEIRPFQSAGQHTTFVTGERE
jgi:2,3-bisphosphoglycerate-dependent phosphoglycerate mutase